MFNIEQFLQEHDIMYHTSGKDVAKGNINIKCPFCGELDKRWHMGINLTKNWYGCWKDTSHRGKDISYLLAKLLNCSIKYAKSIVYKNNHTTISNETSLTSQIRDKLFKTSSNTITKDKCQNDTDLKEFDMFKSIILNSVYYKYLKNRGFDNIALLIDKYNLKFSQSGKWIGRIIFPVYINSNLVTWQGRDITDKSRLRYLDESKKVKKYIYNYDNLNGDILYICEGVIDALKLDFYTPSEISATCIFTKSITKEQYDLLFNIIGRFKGVRILLDRGELKASNDIKNELSIFHKNIKVVILPEDVKDVGEMNKEQIEEYFNEN